MFNSIIYSILSIKFYKSILNFSNEIDHNECDFIRTEQRETFILRFVDREKRITEQKTIQ